MAALTTAAILERFETVLQAPPCLLQPSANPFTETTVANVNVDTVYKLTANGIISDRITSNFQSVRLERIGVCVYKAMQFDGYQAQREIQDLLDTIERAIVADGPDQGYMATLEKGSRKVTRPKGTDLCEATLSFLVDYDFDESAS